MRPASGDLDNTLGTGPFDAALRAAVSRRGLTLDRLRSHLDRRGIPVGLSSLSDWQRGRSRPTCVKSLRAVQALEEILGLPRRSLLALLGPPRGPAGRAVRDGLDERAGPVGELLAGLPGSRDRGLDVLSSHNTVLVDAERRASMVQTRLAVRARRDGVDRYVMRYFGDGGCDIDRVELDALENCRLGRVRRHDTEPVLVAELVFDVPLRAGETWVFGKRVNDDTGQPCHEFGHGFRQMEEQYVLEVRFDPATLPVDCHTYARPGLYDQRRRTGDLTLSRHHAVHLVTSGVRVGVVGIGWAWPDAAAF